MIRSKNRDAHPGVYWLKSERRWVARPQVNRVRHRLGSFKTREEALATIRAGGQLFGWRKHEKTRDNHARGNQGAYQYRHELRASRSGAGRELVRSETGLELVRLALEGLLTHST